MPGECLLAGCYRSYPMPSSPKYSVRFSCALPFPFPDNRDFNSAWTSPAAASQYYPSQAVAMGYNGKEEKMGPTCSRSFLFVHQIPPTCLEPGYAWDTGEFSDFKFPYQRATVTIRAFLGKGERAGAWIRGDWPVESRGYPVPLVCPWVGGLTFLSVFPHVFSGLFACCLVKLYYSK